MIPVSDPKDNGAPYVAVLSCGEKPGIHAIQNAAPDLPAVPGKQPPFGRPYECNEFSLLLQWKFDDFGNNLLVTKVKEENKYCDRT